MLEADERCLHRGPDAHSTRTTGCLAASVVVDESHIGKDEPVPHATSEVSHGRYVAAPSPSTSMVRGQILGSRPAPGSSMLIERYRHPGPRDRCCDCLRRRSAPAVHPSSPRALRPAARKSPAAPSWLSHPRAHPRPGQPRIPARPKSAHRWGIENGPDPSVGVTTLAVDVLPAAGRAASGRLFAAIAPMTVSVLYPAFHDSHVAACCDWCWRRDRTARPDLLGPKRLETKPNRYTLRKPWTPTLTPPLGIRQSVGRTGICFDNALAESFNAAVKVERVHRTAYPTRKKAREDIARYIEIRYNCKRLHSALGYRTPQEVHDEYLNRQLAA